jgi:predicted GH43/DUF377 family glycosyl hydrolase
MLRETQTRSAVLLDNTVRIFYGCADTVVSMAEANLDDLLHFTKTHSY